MAFKIIKLLTLALVLFVHFSNAQNLTPKNPLSSKKETKNVVRDNINRDKFGGDKVGKDKIGRDKIVNISNIYNYNKEDKEYAEFLRYKAVSPNDRYLLYLTFEVLKLKYENQSNENKNKTDQLRSAFEKAIDSDFLSKSNRDTLAGLNEKILSKQGTSIKSTFERTVKLKFETLEEQLDEDLRIKERRIKKSMRNSEIAFMSIIEGLSDKSIDTVKKSIALLDEYLRISLRDTNNIFYKRDTLAWIKARKRTELMPPSQYSVWHRGGYFSPKSDYDKLSRFEKKEYEVDVDSALHMKIFISQQVPAIIDLLSSRFSSTNSVAEIDKLTIMFRDLAQLTKSPKLYENLKTYLEPELATTENLLGVLLIEGFKAFLINGQFSSSSKADIRRVFSFITMVSVNYYQQQRNWLRASENLIKRGVLVCFETNNRSSYYSFKRNGRDLVRHLNLSIQELSLLSPLGNETLNPNSKVYIQMADKIRIFNYKLEKLSQISRNDFTNLGMMLPKSDAFSQNYCEFVRKVNDEYR